MTKGAPIPQELHIVILTLHSIAHMQWDEISTQLKVHSESARWIIQRSKDRVGNEFFALLNDVGHDEPIYPAGPSQKYPEGSNESEQLKEVALNPENFGQNPVQLARLAYLDVFPSTAYRYIHQHHNFAPYKPRQFTLMLSGHFAHGYRGEPYIWVKETLKEQDEHEQELQEENLQKQKHQEEMCANARTLGTEEYKILEAINADIRNYNENRLPNEPRRMPRCPEWVFK
ncbi:hypothetical protein B9Z19DRAFT_1124650 [Tuber borchii]|uniref:Uncharacterized protein n=1 Tax=Tuber borchii TaxID=42251 RepID=A0A2T6ZWF6_TUBBO|nr:hypothetical protein B9Z19DRAFT_1124650 [Tuber borchii]